MLAIEVRLSLCRTFCVLCVVPRENQRRSIFAHAQFLRAVAWRTDVFPHKHTANRCDEALPRCLDRRLVHRSSICSGEQMQFVLINRSVRSGWTSNPCSTRYLRPRPFRDLRCRRRCRPVSGQRRGRPRGAIQLCEVDKLRACIGRNRIRGTP